jgi:hypothetical protein
MGCDIYSRVQVKKDGEWKTVIFPIFPSVRYDLFKPASSWEEATAEPFNWRSYGMFGFLANVRNYSHVPPLSEPRGFPEDMDGADPDDLPYGDHSFSWLSLPELLAFNYDQTFEDRRCTCDGSGAADAGEGNGEITTYRKFLGHDYFRDLAIMQLLGEDPANVRVVFGFDS